MAWTLDIVEVGTIPSLPWTIYLPNAAPAAVLDVPCYCYLLTAPGACLMIDTGPDRERSGRVGFDIVGDAKAALRAALRRRGRTPDDVDTVVQSHLHYDHIQNLALFPRAAVVVQEREMTWAMSGDADRFCVGIAEFRAEAGARLQTITGEVEIYPGLRLLPNGGHTPGHQSMLVETDEGMVCIGADILPMAANLSVCPPSADPAATVRFRTRVWASGWELLPGHDPGLRFHRWYMPSSTTPPR